MAEIDTSNMTPEQSLALQKKQCLFCHIIAGEVASKRVFENEQFVGILDINPANPGHVLLLTREHISVMPQLDEKSSAELGIATKKISHSLIRALKAQGTSIFIANGAVAGQRISHFMAHIIPRFENDGVGLRFVEHEAKVEELREVVSSLKTPLSDYWGIEIEEDAIDVPVGNASSEIIEGEIIGRKKIEPTDFTPEKIGFTPESIPEKSISTNIIPQISKSTVSSPITFSKDAKEKNSISSKTQQNSQQTEQTQSNTKISDTKKISSLDDVDWDELSKLVKE